MTAAIHRDITQEAEGLAGRQLGPVTMNRVMPISENDYQTFLGHCVTYRLITLYRRGRC